MNKQEATAVASKLKKLLDKDWKIKIFQNMEWFVFAHYKKGSLSLHYHQGRWFVMFSLCEKYPGEGEPNPGWWSRQGFADPREAIVVTRSMMRKKLMELTSHVKKYLGEAKEQT